MVGMNVILRSSHNQNGTVFFVVRVFLRVVEIIVGAGGFDHGIKSGWERVLSKHSDFSLKKSCRSTGE